MAEYIEREKVLSLQTDLHFDNIEQLKHWKCRHIDPTEVQLLPAADVRPVVLCLHCKNWDTSWAPDCGKEYGHFCPMVGTVTYADWFCADGEKREETNNGN